MPFNGSGTYALPVSTDYPAIADTEISSEDHNATLEDVAAALGETILRDGQAPFEANQSMGGFRLTNVGDATADTDACPKGQVDDLITAAEFNTALPLQSATTTGQFVKSNGTNALWANVGYTREARTSNTILGLADALKFIDVTTGGFTQTFGAAATLGAAWSCLYRNGSTTDVTLDPNSSETIDGLTSFVMYPGETRLIQCDGTNLFSVVVRGFSKTFTSSGTFTKPPGYSLFQVFAQGPGGGGGSGATATSGADISGGGGGGGGGQAQAYIPASAVASSETVTVGTGGVGGASVTNAGTAAGNAGSAGSSASSFGTWLAASAGAGGDGGVAVATAAGGAGGTAAAHIVAAGAGGGVSNAVAGAAGAGTATTTTWAPTGGGGGGGRIGSGSGNYAPAAGGASGTSSSTSQIAGGTAGTSGTTGTAGAAGNVPTNTFRGGTGGGGGGYGSAGAGGAGGAGAYGGGGGGGGGAVSTAATGAGGAGGNGVVIVQGVV